MHLVENYHSNCDQNDGKTTSCHCKNPAVQQLFGQFWENSVIGGVKKQTYRFVRYDTRIFHLLINIILRCRNNKIMYLIIEELLSFKYFINKIGTHPSHIHPNSVILLLLPPPPPLPPPHIICY